LFIGINDEKNYDMIGKKVITTIIGLMYIRDNQKFIIVQ